MTALTAASGLTRRSAPARELLRATRPRQWIKNLLVLAAPSAAGAVLRHGVLLRCAIGVVALTFAASALYLINDVLDVELDRLHARKSLRPIASGTVSVRTALVAAAVLLGAGLALAAAVGTGLLRVVVVYIAITLLYGVWLKHVPWVEMALVASGFVLRTLAGAAAAGVDASEWFVLVVSAAAVVVVVAKRHSEVLGAYGAARPVLRHYRDEQLLAARWAAAAVLVSAYAGWAYVRPTPLVTQLAWASLVPVVLVTTRWNVRTSAGGTGAPEDVLAEDRWVQVGTAAWLVLFALTVGATLWL